MCVAAFCDASWGVWRIPVSVKLHHGNPGAELGSFAEWSIFDRWKGMMLRVQPWLCSFRATRGKSFCVTWFHTREFATNCEFEKQSALMSRREKRL